jgi:hypothetical protein
MFSHNYKTQSHTLDRAEGVLRTGSIENIDSIYEGIVHVRLTGSPTNQPLIPIKIPQTLSLNNGMFIGSKPTVGSTIVLGVDGNNQHYFTSYVAENVDQLPAIENDEILIYANGQTSLSLNKETNDIFIGTSSVGVSDSKLHINADNSYNLISTNFYNEHHLTQASRQFTGLIKRESKEALEKTKWALNSRLYDDSYDNQYNIIGLDPSFAANLSTYSKSKNPPFVESREIIYEFAENSDVKNELDEASVYSKAGANKYSYFQTNRRKTKSDTLSLTLAYPNYLIETVKGTVVDIFGNILDLNRAPLPVGVNQATLKSDNVSDLSKSYLSIREIERKSIAFHFELNARKDLKNRISKSSNFTDLFGYNEKFPNADYGRLRSRFFLDIDKEGLFKLNVPSSSETGNIPFLTRYENFSTISPEDNNNPNKLIYNKNSTDILQDSFACPQLYLDPNNDEVGNYSNEPGSIKILDGDSPITLQDRRYTDKIIHMKHGTAFHDILSTCFLHQTEVFLDYVQDETLPETLYEYIPLLTDVVSNTIQTSGDKANAGGRSGVLNFDGSLEMSIGANTIDRQSLWLDTAGGVVANIGRDLKNMSAALSMNGDVFVQIGGFGVSGDSRFVKQQNGNMAAVLDLRVMNDGETATMLRIDSRGVTIMTPTNINIYFGGDMRIAGGTLNVDVEELILQGRGVNKESGGSI